MAMTLDLAFELIASARDYAKETGLKPLTIAVLDAGGHLTALVREDGTSTLRAKIAQGKAHGAIALGLGSRAIYNRAKEQPYFVQSMNALCDGNLVPVPGGVLIREGGQIIGALGITGDNSDNDEACAIFAIEKAGLTADEGKV